MNLYFPNQLFHGDMNALAHLASINATDSEGSCFCEPIIFESRAIIPVSGLIVKRSNLSVKDQQQYGVCDLDNLNYQIGLLPGKVTQALFHFDTCGGYELGLYDTWERINALGNYGITTIAYSDTRMLSAGMLLASACDIIVASDDALVGSVGVIRFVTKTTKQDEQEGIETFVYRSGQNKDKYNPVIPWTSEDDSAEKDQIIKAGAKMWEHVNRKHTFTEDVKAAGTYQGEAALNRGLVEMVERLNLF